MDWQEPPKNKSLHIELHYAKLNKNGRVKLAHYLVQLINLDEPNDRWKQWFPKRQGIVSDPILARGIDNIYH